MPHLLIYISLDNVSPALWWAVYFLLKTVFQAFRIWESEEYFQYMTGGGSSKGQVGRSAHCLGAWWSDQARPLARTTIV